MMWHLSPQTRILKIEYENALCSILFIIQLLAPHSLDLHRRVKEDQKPLFLQLFLLRICGCLKILKKISRKCSPRRRQRKITNSFPPTATTNLQLNMAQFLQLHKSLALVKLLHQIGQTRRQVGTQGGRQPKQLLSQTSLMAGRLTTGRELANLELLPGEQGCIKHPNF